MTGEGTASRSSELACPSCGNAMVRRIRRSDDAPFWGCPNFPACRGTRPIEAIATVRPDEPAAPVAGAVPWDDRSWQRSDAGASARSSYVRRRDRHRQRVRDNRGRILMRSATLAVVGIGLASVSPSWAFAGWALVLLAIFSGASRLFVLPNHVRAWDIGAKGEERMAERLDALEDEGFVVLHDRRIPGRRENIDHVVVGPPGIFTIEVKNYGGLVRVRGQELLVDGRRKTEFIDQALRQAEAVRAIVDDVPVGAIVAFPRADFPLFGRQRLEAVEALSASGVLRRLRTALPVLDDAQVERIARELDASLSPAARA